MKSSSLYAITFIKVRQEFTSSKNLDKVSENSRNPKTKNVRFDEHIDFWEVIAVVVLIIVRILYCKRPEEQEFSKEPLIDTCDHGR